MAAAGHDRYSPITTREVFSLKNLGINEQSMTSNHITVESDKYICIRETDSVTIIDINEHTNRLEIDKTAASAIMNPCFPILAYIKRSDETTSKDKLRIYNIETKMKMKAHNMNEKVVFWKWITPTVLGLVTQTAVHHWSTEGSTKPVKVFDRSANLATSTITSYQYDPSEKWCALIGTWRDPLFSGKMQLFSVEEQSSQEFDAIVADFTTFKVPENDAPSTLMCFATGSVTYESERYRIQLNVIELGKPGSAKKQAEFRIGYWPGFPFSLQISEKYGWVSVITKRGLVIMHDLETASPIYSYNMSDHYMILTTKSKTGGGFYSINEGGQVLLTQVNEYTITDEDFLFNDTQTTQHQQGLRAFLVRSKKQGHQQQKKMRDIDRLNQNDELRKERDDLKWRLFRLEVASSNDLDVKLTEFTYEQIRDVTNDFSDSLKIGEGGFGRVYKPINGHPFAIKRPIGDSSQVTRALNQELEISTKLRHPNIAKVVGICKEPLILIYELMPNGSLYDILRNEERSKELTWKRRIYIASNICEALKYIHSSEPPLVHGDLTPANILLDSNYIAKLTDFGIGRYLQKTTTRDTPHHYTEEPKGVREYIDPAYFNMGEMTTQSDIYSLGIILLELVTREHPWGLRKTVERALVKGKIFVDPSAGEWPFEQAKKMLQLGLRCSDISRKDRPNLVKEVMVEIESMRRASLRF